jgi:carbon monoxide dehydrogenase subunit G
VRIENSFVVEAPVEDAWALLMDVPRIVPCMPGATITDTVDDDHWKAKMAVKLGPISLNFDTAIARESADASARRAVLSADARESKGRGSAKATIESSLAEQDGGTRVDIVTDLALTGPVAQYGRGLVQSVASQLTATFAGCLQQQLAPAAPSGDAGEDQTASGPPAPAPSSPSQPHSVSGFRLGLNALLEVLHLRHPHGADADR